METKIAEMAIKSQMDSMKKNMMSATQPTSSSSGEVINWSEFNFPPGIRIMHKNFSEIRDNDKRRLCKMMYMVFLIIFLLLIINFINQIILVAIGASGMYIFYSILQMFIFLPL